jgi:hypothetical protein
MFASVKKLFAQTTPRPATPAGPAALAVESLETREVPAVDAFIWFHTQGLAGPTAVVPDAGGQLVRIQGLGHGAGGAEAGDHFNQGRNQETGDDAAGFLSKVTIDFSAEPQPGSPVTISRGWDQILNTPALAGSTAVAADAGGQLVRVHGLGHGAGETGDLFSRDRIQETGDGVQMIQLAKASETQQTIGQNLK